MPDLHFIKPSDFFNEIRLSRSCNTHHCDKNRPFVEAWEGNFQFLGPELAEEAMLGGRRRLTGLNHDWQRTIGCTAVRKPDTLLEFKLQEQQFGDALKRSG